MTGRKTVSLAALMATALASCGGVRTQDEPTPIDSANVPEVLVTEEGGNAEDGDTESVEPPEINEDKITGPAVWFIRAREDEVRLLKVPREPTPPATMTSLLEALLDDPPSEEERAQNITTAIPETTELARPPRHSGDVLIIDLTAGIWDVQGPDLRNAFGQIVCTVTRARGVERADEVKEARFLVNGEPTSVLEGSGAETRAPVSCDDYGDLTEEPDAEDAEDTDDTQEDADAADADAADAEGADAEGADAQAEDGAADKEGAGGESTDAQAEEGAGG